MSFIPAREQDAHIEYRDLFKLQCFCNASKCVYANQGSAELETCKSKAGILTHDKNKDANWF